MGEKETDAGLAERKKDSGISGQVSTAGMPSYREAAGGGGSGGDAPEAAINNAHSNIKNLREGGISHEDDWHDSGKLAPERPVKSEIAIGDPGVNGNISGDAPDIAVGEPGWNTGIAVTDEGVPAARPAPRSD